MQNRWDETIQNLERKTLLGLLLLQPDKHLCVHDLGRLHVLGRSEQLSVISPLESWIHAKSFV